MGGQQSPLRLFRGATVMGWAGPVIEYPSTCFGEGQAGAGGRRRSSRSFGVYFGVGG